MLLICVSGCGTVAGNAFFNAATATSQTFFDLLLTAAVNAALDLVNPPPAPPADQQGGGTPNFEGLTGDAANGQMLFTSNGCLNCHCEDASGGCALDAPSLVGVSAAQLNDRLRGEISHPGGKFDLTDQEIVDLEAFLAAPGG